MIQVNPVVNRTDFNGMSPDYLVGVSKVQAEQFVEKLLEMKKEYKGFIPQKVEFFKMLPEFVTGSKFCFCDGAVLYTEINELGNFFACPHFVDNPAFCLGNAVNAPISKMLSCHRVEEMRRWMKSRCSCFNYCTTGISMLFKSSMRVLVSDSITFVK